MYKTDMMRVIADTDKRLGFVNKSIDNPCSNAALLRNISFFSKL